MKLIEASVKRPVGVIMCIVALLILGAISVKNLAVELYPDINLPMVAVVTSYQGASPQEMERLITEPIEEATGTLEGIDTIQSISSPSSSMVMMLFDYGKDMDEIMNNVRERVDGVRAMLPDDSGDPSVLKLDPQQIPILYLGVAGAPPEDLQDIIESTIEPNFKRVSGVGSISSMGGKEREIRVIIDQTKLRGYGLSTTQVVQAISSVNQSASAGTLEKGTQELQVRIDGEYTSIEDIQKTPISLTTGQTVKVEDIATVEDTFKELSSISEVNGESAVVLSVLKQSDANTVEVADEMYKAIDDINEQLKDQGISVSTIFDTSTFVRSSINSVVENMVVGAVLAVLVLLLFLRSLRATFVIGLSIPIAIVITFCFMYFTGQTLNVLSMGGLALGAGMMVDSSIVILENIVQKRENGMPLKQAAIVGGKELASGVLAAALTSTVVFFPIMFTEGLSKELFLPLALAVIFSNLGALIAAFTTVPMFASKLLTKVKPKNEVVEVEDPEKAEKKKNRFFHFVLRFANSINKRYRKFLEWALRHRKTVLITTTLLVIGSCALVPFIGFSFIPSADQGQIEIHVEGRQGAKLEETEKIVTNINKRLEKYESIIETNYVLVGGNATGFGPPDTSIASFTLQLVEKGARDLPTIEIVKQFEKDLADIPGAEISVAESTGGMEMGSPISVEISGEDLDVLEDLAQQVVWVLEDIEGIYNIDSPTAEGRPEIDIKLDHDLLSQYGLSYQEVMSQIRLGFDGQVATQYREDGNESDVRVMFPEEQRQTIRDLENMMVVTNTGQQIPLSVIAQLEQIQGPAEITHNNQVRHVNITSDIRDRTLGEISQEAQAKLDRIATPEGYTVSMGGQSEDSAESYNSLGLALLLAIFLVYFVMAVQFESFSVPFVIMFSMPTALVGIFLGLFITGTPMSITALVGIIMLAGIVVSNAIILIEYILIQRRNGLERFDAIISAGTSRVRPILMTTLATILGMVPVALGIGEGAETQAPMGITIIFGLSASTVFTLILIPVMYTLIDDLGGFWKRRKEKRAAKREAKRLAKNNETTIDA